MKFNFSSEEEKLSIISEKQNEGLHLHRVCYGQKENYLFFSQEPYIVQDPPLSPLSQLLEEKDREIKKLQTNMDNAVLELTMLIAMGGMPNV